MFFILRSVTWPEYNDNLFVPGEAKLPDKKEAPGQEHMTGRRAKHLFFRYAAFFSVGGVSSGAAFGGFVAFILERIAIATF